LRTEIANKRGVGKKKELIRPKKDEPDVGGKVPADGMVDSYAKMGAFFVVKRNRGGGRTEHLKAEVRRG